MRFSFLVLIILLSSCDYLRPKKAPEEKIVAKVGEEVLGFSTLQKLLPENISPKDSTSFAEKFIKNWIKKQLLVNKAKESTEINEAAIQQKVLDYQYALTVHDYEKQYIDKNLNREVSEKEVEKYYQEKSENFILRQNLVKCLFFKIPKKAPNKYRFKSLVKKYPKDSSKLLSYANEFAQKAFVEETNWVKFDEVILETPLKDTNDKTRLLKTNSFIESKDDNFAYFVKILDKKLIGDVAPLSFIGESVKTIILNKRKIVLKKELEKRIYEEAKASNAFEIYKN